MLARPGELCWAGKATIWGSKALRYTDFPMTFADPTLDPRPSGDLIKEGTDASFMKDVIEASKTQPVIVDFWATWCGPCVAEIPNVLEQYEKYHAQGFEVVGISLDQDRDALEKFVADRKIPWPILFEPSEGAGWQHPLATYYGISGIPTVILIGRDGKVVTLNARGERLGEELDKIFAGQAAAGS